MRSKVFAAHRMSELARTLLEKYREVDYWERSPRDELPWRVEDKDALICPLMEKVNDELPDRRRNCGRDRNSQWVSDVLVPLHSR